MNFFKLKTKFVMFVDMKGPCNSSSVPQESKVTGWKSLQRISSSLPEHHNTLVLPPIMRI